MSALMTCIGIAMSLHGEYVAVENTLAAEIVKNCSGIFRIQIDPERVDRGILETGMWKVYWNSSLTTFS